MENTQSARAGLLTNGVNNKVEMLHNRASVQLFPNLCSNSLRELQRRDSTRFVVSFCRASSCAYVSLSHRDSHNLNVTLFGECVQTVSVAAFTREKQRRPVSYLRIVAFRHDDGQGPTVLAPHRIQPILHPKGSPSWGFSEGGATGASPGGP